MEGPVLDLPSNRQVLLRPEAARRDTNNTLDRHEDHLKASKASRPRTGYLCRQDVLEMPFRQTIRPAKRKGGKTAAKPARLEQEA